MTMPKALKTGGDPRTLPDYAALRDELRKLTHPARPDVNWGYAEKCCLSLFEQNGVELQSAAWYTLARLHLAGLPGLNEGLEILEALISHQWSLLWPEPVNARMEILRSLSQRLQQRLRSLPLTSSDLSQRERAEHLLTRLGVLLPRLEPEHPNPFDSLRTLMHNSAVRPENSDDSSTEATIQSDASALNGAGVSTGSDAGGSSEDAPTPDRAVKWIYVVQPEQQPNEAYLPSMPIAVNRWKSFAAGMGTMMLISTVAVWGWYSLHRPDPLQTQLAASLTPLPALLDPEQLDMLRRHSSLSQSVIAQTQQQIAWLEKLPPDWNMAYSRKLTEQAHALWPEQAKPLIQQWQQQLNAAALPEEQLNGWHQGMATLLKLSDRLNALDEQKGKYMTVSELKTVVFSAMQSFNTSIPAEEQLRALSQHPEKQPLPAAASAQLEMHLKQVIARYAAIKQNLSK